MPGPNELDDDDLPPTSDDPRRGLGGATDAVRKLLLAGAGTLFMTEEGVRSMIKELKLPKEALGYLVTQADKTKGEVVRVVAQELRAFLESAKVREDLVAMLQQLTFEVKAEIKVKPRREGDGLFAPDVRVKTERAPKATTRRRKAKRA